MNPTQVNVIAFQVGLVTINLILIVNF